MVSCGVALRIILRASTLKSKKPVQAIKGREKLIKRKRYFVCILGLLYKMLVDLF